jgi:hypothetical protein
VASKSFLVQLVWLPRDDAIVPNFAPSPASRRKDDAAQREREDSSSPPCTETWGVGFPRRRPKNHRRSPACASGVVLQNYLSTGITKNVSDKDS